MNLALTLGVNDPRDLRKWPAVVVALWLTYFNVQPYGPIATDLREGIANFRAVSIHVDKKSKDKMRLRDYILGEVARDMVSTDDDGLPEYGGGE